MKKHFPFLFLLIVFFAHGQIPKGKVVYDRLYSKSLENLGGEDPTRSISVYLPPGYDQSTDNYPVIYYLHGITQSDSSLIANNHIDKLLDKAIAMKRIKPVILVIPNHYTLYRGSFYTNSQLTGNWSDFTAKDLVRHIDKKYRTIPEWESRGIAGHSMGGHGAIKLGMLFPDVFSSVYALSPYVLGLEEDYGPDGQAYKQAQLITSRDTLITGYKYMNANAVIALGRAFSPNPNNPPFYADLPYSYEGDSLLVHKKVLDQWKANLPLEMVNMYADSLKKLKAIKLDWGSDDFFRHIPPTSQKFSQKLQEFNIVHFAEEYNGSHMEKIYSEPGRFWNDLLPFFNRYLTFEKN